MQKEAFQAEPIYTSFCICVSDPVSAVNLGKTRLFTFFANILSAANIVSNPENNRIKAAIVEYYNLLLANIPSALILFIFLIH